MVRWNKVRTRELIDRIKSAEIRGSELIEMIDGPTLRYCPPSNPELFVEMDVRNLIMPLGNFGWALFLEKDYQGIADALRRYWSLKGEPRFIADGLVVDTESGTDTITLRIKDISKRRTSGKSLAEMLSHTNFKKVGERFSDTVIGSDGASLELQFLARDEVAEGKEAGDILNPGIFVRVNGKIEVAPGVHRVVCTNGLVRRMYLWQKDSFDFLSQSMLDESRKLLDWFVRQVGKKVKSLREVSVVLGDKFPAGITNRFWKEWGQKIELNELDWYDVINDVTRAVNGTLSSVRYKVLSVGERAQQINGECSCPVCSAKVTIGR